MKTLNLLKLTMVCAIGMFVATSCDNDDDDFHGNVPAAVQAAFDQKYSGVARVEWDMEQGGYLVAEFFKDGREHEAWFTAGGEWVMTEIDYGRNFQDLPEAVREGYSVTTYALQDWFIDDIDEIQRPAYDNVYIIEVEQGGRPDYSLYFDANGTLIREVQENGGGSHDDMISNTMPLEIQQFINTKYPGATVVDIDIEHNGYEIDVRHDGMSKEIVFDSDYNWVMTSTDYTLDIPAAVRSAVEANYPGKRIDDCDYIETAAGEEYYLVDLDNYARDLKITLDGQITEVPES